MKRILFSLFLSIMALGAFAQMSDSQIMSFYQREAKAGTSQGQIVTKLMQRGVNIDQIRRIRSQYTSSQSASKNAATADGTIRKSNESPKQELTSQNVDLNNTSQEKAETQYVRVQRSIDETTDDKTTADGKEVLTPDGRKVFGRDIFNNKLLSFEPNMNIATPTNYRIGPGDEVVIEIYGASQKSLTLSVTPEGTVTVPGYGPIYISGMSVGAANAKIRSTLGSRYSSSQIKATVGHTRTMIVNVMCEF